MNDTAVLYILVVLFSLCVGSFLNVVIYRLPLMLRQAEIQACESVLHLNPTQSMSINLFLPRSFCTFCKTPVKIWNNIPLLSYFLLKRKCKTCNNAIPWTYPLVECLAAGLAVLCVWFYGFSLTGLFAACFCFFLIALFFIDLKHQLLPDSLTLSLLWIGLFANTFSLFTSLEEAVLATLFGWLSLWIFVSVYHLIRGKAGMGQGDLKLFAAFAAWFGSLALPFILIFSSLTGVLAGMVYLKTTKQSFDTAIPFGPFLCVAALVFLLGRDRILPLFG